MAKDVRSCWAIVENLYGAWYVGMNRFLLKYLSAWGTGILEALAFLRTLTVQAIHCMKPLD